MVCRYEKRRIARTPSSARVIGTTMAKMPMAAALTRTLRISSVAYADDERLSLANTARAVGLPRRSWTRRSVERGVPTARRFRRRKRWGTRGASQLRGSYLRGSIVGNQVEAVGHRGDDHGGLEQERPLQDEGGVVVEQVVPGFSDDELGDDDRDVGLGIGFELRPDPFEGGASDLAVGGRDHLEGHPAADRLVPVGNELWGVLGIGL